MPGGLFGPKRRDVDGETLLHIRLEEALALVWYISDALIGLVVIVDIVRR